MSDVLRMQQEAEARVRAMRERSRRLVDRIPQETPPAQVPCAPSGGILSHWDSDQLMLLLLAVLLIRNNAPPELIAVLLYIAL